MTAYRRRARRDTRGVACRRALADRLCKTLNDLGKRPRPRLAAAKSNPAPRNFIRRTFHGDVGGHA